MGCWCAALLAVMRIPSNHDDGGIDIAPTVMRQYRPATCRAGDFRSPESALCRQYSPSGGRIIATKRRAHCQEKQRTDYATHNVSSTSSAQLGLSVGAVVGWLRSPRYGPYPTPPAEGYFQRFSLSFSRRSAYLGRWVLRGLGSPPAPATSPSPDQFRQYPGAFSQGPILDALLASRMNHHHRRARHFHKHPKTMPVKVDRAFEWQLARTPYIPAPAEFNSIDRPLLWFKGISAPFTGGGRSAMYWGAEDRYT